MVWVNIVIMPITAISRQKRALQYNRRKNREQDTINYIAYNRYITQLKVGNASVAPLHVVTNAHIMDATSQRHLPGQCMLYAHNPIKLIYIDISQQ